MNQSIINLSGKFQKDKYIPINSTPRDNYIRNVNDLAEAEGYSFFVELTSDYIKHLDRQFTANFYFRDWARILPILKRFYGDGLFYVVNGFRSPFELGVGIHSTGLAMDILVEDQEDADRLMGAAYMTGIPTIIPVGDIRRGQGHIHLDLAPKPTYSYNAGTYNGPWE